MDDTPVTLHDIHHVLEDIADYLAQICGKLDKVGPDFETLKEAIASGINYSGAFE